nr:hypothetical protein [Candidatus Bathyarchaeota archaeon]
MADNDKQAIREVIEEAYVNGVHRHQDETKMKDGFHQDFAMLVLSNNKIDKVNVDEWLKRVAEMKEKDPELWKSETSYDFRLVDVTRNAAVAKLDVYKGTTQFSTDYM